MTTFAPGIYPGIPMQSYREAEGVNVSALKEMALSPKHFLQAKTAPPEEPTDAQRIGTIVHSVILENDHSHYVIRPHGMKFTTKEGKEWRDQQTKEIITREEADDLHGMVTSIKNHPMAARIIYGPGGQNEVSGFKKDIWTELMKKGRADRLTVDSQEKTVCVDLKTCDRGGASEREFSRAIVNWGYDVQSSYYTDIFECSFFVFVCVEKLAPYAVNCFALAPEAIEVGRKKYRKYLAKVRECRDSGIWPAYGEGLNTITLPDWEFKKEI